MKDINNIFVPVDAKTEEVYKTALKKSGLSKNSITGFKVIRRSVDARHKNVRFNYCIRLYTGDENNFEKKEQKYGTKKLNFRPVIIGTGPAGLFCAYNLAKHGYKPVLIERGDSVKNRINSVERFYKSGNLDMNTNIQFGEGGAGTFSDGKLTTRINSPQCENVLSIFRKFGAPKDILYLAKPHIGTDILRNVIVNIRKDITDNGGSVEFLSRLENIKIKNDKIVSITVNGEERPCDVLILAIGHSARDTYQMLFEKGVFMEPKAFAAGVRIEHKRDFIDKSQYGIYAGHPKLGAADYHLAYNGRDRSCFSFCMCPGGYVTAASSEDGGVVVNGMSNYKRDGDNSNSALVVNVTAKDFSGVLGGIEFQRKMERAAFFKNNPYFAPVQNTNDFINNKTSFDISGITPTYPVGKICADLNKILPGFISKTLRESLLYFDTKIKNFTENSVLTGVETRTSSPLRITRNKDMQSINVSNLYPVGEGAGYAGGIMSSAADGLNLSEKLISAYSPF